MAFRELKPERAAAGSSLRTVNASVQSAWAAQRRKRIKNSLWWALPMIVVCGIVGSAMTRRGYFGVGFAVLVGLALADVAYTKPGHVSLAGRRAFGEAATARAIKPLRFQGFTALHDRRLAANAVAGIPPVDIEHLLIGPAGVFLLDSKNWTSGPAPQMIGNKLFVGMDDRESTLKRLGLEAQNLTSALGRSLPSGVKVEPVLVVHAKDLQPTPRFLEGVTILLPDQLVPTFSTMRQRMTATQAAKLAGTLDTLLPTRTGDKAIRK
ncbi:NERD domain-containing protein [Catenulispora sp. NF23]|uniref:NERD domain-containing protein n=1 Tax=Catenulispora pinistramenti TaxID=2705254 RepID=A0ABS5KK09_9ACTN|nr:nuclease-related domain-containing protein [Catenulispora pinistramenti]MBS2532234.1 NERD domain-containing protein [Catenulispora pinistramenti]MBS2546365.1 NERD domain-containing protein [Catenulispora pinistramenti]